MTAHNMLESDQRATKRLAWSPAPACALEATSYLPIATTTTLSQNLERMHTFKHYSMHPKRTRKSLLVLVKGSCYRITTHLSQAQAVHTPARAI